MPKLAWLDQSTGLLVRRSKPVRYEKAIPGELVHVDIKKQGRIPNGGGHRKFGRTVGNHNNQKGGRGYSFLHHAVDDHSRLAYSETLDDEKKETASGFWLRANQFFADAGITVTAVMTDNGSGYRSAAFTTALGAAIKGLPRVFDDQGTLLIEHPWPAPGTKYVGSGGPRGPRGPRKTR